MLFLLSCVCLSAVPTEWLCVLWSFFIIDSKFGMQLNSPIEIKERLLKALDSEYNVVDMPTVLEVILALEQIKITSEILEATRLGKLINEFRRKTTNEALAKRAKDLVRRWRRKLVSVVPDGEIPALENGCVSESERKGNWSLSGVTNNDDTSCVPKTHASNKRPRNDTSPQLGPTRKIPKLNGVSHSSFYSSSADITVDCLSGQLIEKPVAASICPESRVPLFPECPLPSPPLAAGQREKSISLPAKKKRGPYKKTKMKSVSQDIIKEKLEALTKLGRVKTTEELVADIAGKESNCQVQIEVAKESRLRVRDDVESTPKEIGAPDDALIATDSPSGRRSRDKDVSADVASRKKRGRKSKKKTRDRSTESVAALSTIFSEPSPSESATQSPDSSDMDDLSGNDADNTFVTTEKQSSKRSRKKSKRLKFARCVEKSNKRIDKGIEEILSALPELDLSSVDWCEPDEQRTEQTASTSVDDCDVDKLHHRQSEGLNGNRDELEDTFKEWHRVVTRKTYADNYTYILPYTVVD